MPDETLLAQLLSSLRAFVRERGWLIIEERAVQSGQQVIVTDGINRVPITCYSTGTLVIGGKSSTLQAEFRMWKDGREQSTDNIPNTIARTSRYYVGQDLASQVKDLLQKVSARIQIRESGLEQHCQFRAEIVRSNSKVVATLYKTGALLIQGKTSELFEDICRELESIYPQPFAERGAGFVPEIAREAVLTHLSHPQTERKALDWVYAELGVATYEFMSSPDQQTYLSGAGLLISLQETQLQLPDYSVVVMPFARAYEGFVIQLAVSLQIADIGHIRANAEAFQVGKYINSIKERIEQADRLRYSGLGDTLRSVWTDIRHKVLHADPINPPPHRELQDARQDIHAINRAMKRAHEYLVDRGVIAMAIPTEQGTLGLPVVLTTRSTRIGSDESGKGDYFGPLVVAAVYVDQDTERQLAALGVRDSKKLTDGRVHDLAEEIRRCCAHSTVVAIGPKRYNELYQKIGNLNRLLAWGHARCLENLLAEVTCEQAIADQFGDESFLLNALMKEGRRINLVQRPRAEQDIAVAAASILARDDFVRRLAQLSQRLAIQLPKGTSDPSIPIIGQRIYSQGGREGLAEVAKLHFKTTASIFRD